MGKKKKAKTKKKRACLVLKIYYLTTHKPLEEAETKNKKGAELVDLQSVKMIGVGKIKQYTNVLDRPLSKGKQEVYAYVSKFRSLRYNSMNR